MKNVFALDKKLWCEIHKTPYCPNFLCKEFWGCKTVEAEHRTKLKRIEENKKKYKHPTMTEAVYKHDFNKMCEANYNEMIKKLLKDPLIKKIVEESNEKEVRELSRPYFETEVVKLKVNGENLDKIKFPCFCSYKQPLTDLNKHLGIIEHIAIYGEKARYVLLNIEGQRRGCKLVPIFEDLKSLIESYEINILKGKIIIFEEEDTDLKESVDDLED